MVRVSILSQCEHRPWRAVKSRFTLMVPKGKSCTLRSVSRIWPIGVWHWPHLMCCFRPSRFKYTEASFASQSISICSITQPGNANIGRSEGVTHMSDPSEILIHSNQSFPEGYFLCNLSFFISQPVKAQKLYYILPFLRSPRQGGQWLHYGYPQLHGT